MTSLKTCDTLQMARALEALHGQGMAHMDVKPENIMLGEDGLYKLGDFGLACRMSGVSTGVTFSEGDCRCASCVGLRARV